MRPFRVEDAGRVGIEGDGEGLAAEKTGASDDLRDDSLVAKMHAVEVANGGDDGGGRGGQFGELAVDDHASGEWSVISGRSKVSCRPS